MGSNRDNRVNEEDVSRPVAQVGRGCVILLESSDEEKNVGHGSGLEDQSPIGSPRAMYKENDIADRGKKKERERQRDAQKKIKMGAGGVVFSNHSEQ